MRAGVAPDHQATKQVDEALRGDRASSPASTTCSASRSAATSATTSWPRATTRVVYAVGAANDRRLGDPGRGPARLGLRHRPRRLVQRPPRQAGPARRRSTPRAGRRDRQRQRRARRRPHPHRRPDDLARTDIAALPWAALRRSRVREVVVLGRRGPADAAFTVPELVGLAGLDGPQRRRRHRRRADRPATPRKLAAARRARRPAAPGAAHARAPVPHHARCAILGDDAGHRRRGRPRDGATEVIACRPGAPGDRLPRRAGRRPALRRRDRHRPERPRPGARRASTSPAGSSAARPASSAPTSRARRRPSSGCSTTSTPGRLPGTGRHPRDLDRARSSRGRDPDVVDLAGWRAIDARGTPPRRGLRPPAAKIVDPDECCASPGGDRRTRRATYPVRAPALAGGRQKRS